RGRGRPHRRGGRGRLRTCDTTRDPSGNGRRARSARDSRSLSEDLHDDALLPAPVELGVEDLLPRTQVELTLGDGQDHLMVHERALQMRVAVALAGLMVAV